VHRNAGRGREEGEIWEGNEKEIWRVDGESEGRERGTAEKCRGEIYSLR
jgi:hypothetical protein